MSYLCGDKVKKDVKRSGDGLLELSEEKMRALIRSEPITDVYHVEQKPFARGKFAAVRKIRHLESGIEYAAKFIRKRRRLADTTKEIHHEVAVLAMCADSDRLVRLHEVYDTKTEVALVLELAAGGELQRVLDDEERVNEPNARRAMRHILEGLTHLHARGLAHLDIKPQNLLLTKDLHEGGEVKLCDFGISRVIEPGVEVREILGTPDYVAPEILSYEPISLSTDIWSVGVLAYVLLSGYSPFAGSNKQETFLNISQCALSFPEDIFTKVSDEAFDFIRAALIIDPKGRMTVQQCLDHPWLNEDSKLSYTTQDLEDLLTPSLENYKDSQLCVVIPENGGTTNGDQTEDSESNNSILAHLKHPHHRETSPAFPDAPSTPKVSRKSHPGSPTSVLNLCKKFQTDTTKLSTEKKCEANSIYTGKSVSGVCKAFEAVNGKSHTKENNPLMTSNGTSNGSSCNSCVNYDTDVRKSSESSYDCPKCEVQCCNLVSTHKHNGGPINHVDRAILC